MHHVVANKLKKAMLLVDDIRSDNSEAEVLTQQYVLLATEIAFRW